MKSPRLILGLLLGLLLGAHAGPIGLISLKPAVQEAPAAPVDIGGAWFSAGDSEYDGYGTGTTENPPEAFRAIWDATETPPSSHIINGISGRPLSGTRTYYDEHADKGTRSFVMLMESGDQNEDGQRTASEFGDTFDAFITAILANTPNAVIVMETAFNFGRGPEGSDEEWRDWGPYNTELRARIATWASLGTTIYLAEVDRNIQRLQQLLTPAEVWIQSGQPNNFHYEDAGNLMVALSIYDALHYDVTTLDLSAITNVTAPQKAACLQVIEEYQ